ncbi:MAG TPA: POTRA domain-containing protein, partial [Xanthomonadales bacterium]|nr:POTRA domain-containing protein [Xanthomonadales bacterium]
MNSVCHYSRPVALLHGLLWLVCLAATPCQADVLNISVKGVKEPMLGNVQSRVSTLAINDKQTRSRKRLDRVATEAGQEAVLALRPYGYYHATVSSDLQQQKDGDWLLSLQLTAGPPLKVSLVDIRLSGPGAELEELQEWQRNWPMPVGKRLNQVSWETQKGRALELAESHGYLAAQFTRHEIRADLDHNTAELELHLETGPQAVMGE